MNHHKRLGNDFRRRQKSGQNQRKSHGVMSAIINDDQKFLKRLKYKFRQQYLDALYFKNNPTARAESEYYW